MATHIDPLGDDLPLAIGSRTVVSHDEFASEMANPNSQWEFVTVEFALEVPREVATILQSEVRKFEVIRRRVNATRKGVGASGRGRGGRPYATNFSAAQDIALIATYLLRQGNKRGQSISAAADYWLDGRKYRKEPSGRLIDAEMARLRKGGVVNLELAISAVRTKYGLPVLPSPNSKASKVNRIE